MLVDDNEQAARLSGQLRAELVRLGRVQEDGVPLERQRHFRRGRGPRAGSVQRLAWPGMRATAAARSTAKPSP
jgi:hypothetical protein